MDRKVEGKKEWCSINVVNRVKKMALFVFAVVSGWCCEETSFHAIL